MPDFSDPERTGLSQRQVGLSRRKVLAASGTGLLAATAPASPATTAVPAAATGLKVRKRSAVPGSGDGSPEQIHLTWGDDPATSVVVSWSSAGRAKRPRARIGQRVFAAEERAYTDGASGETVWTYHARVSGLRPGATYGYAVTADNDRNAADPFSETFTTAPAGRKKFRFTSFGDLAGARMAWPLAYPEAAYAVGAVESFQPLFHLLNGDLCDGELNPAAWRDFGGNCQASASNRPWMPVLGNHGSGFYDGPRGFSTYLTRYTLPDNGLPAFAGRWYSFRVGSALFVALDANDVAHGHSRGTQTRWLAQTLEAARRDPSVDWIIAQTHQCACSPAADATWIRSQWLPLFDRYEVDLVLGGHGRGYERSFPVRGFDRAGSAAVAGEYRPRPVTTSDSGVFDTSQGTVHLTLGSGLAPGSVPAQPGDSGEGARPEWSARRDTSAAYGIAVFDVDPGTESGGQTSVTVTRYHAADGVPDGDYTEFETFTLVRPRSDRRRWHDLEPAAVPV